MSAVSERNKRRYHEHKDLGLCVQCSEPAMDGIVHCGEHRKQSNTRKPPITTMLQRARARAKRQGVPYALTKADISIPDRCPLLGIELRFSRGSSTDNSPSLDKIEPSKGYVAENIQVISHKANAMKSNASLESLVLIGKWAERRLEYQKGKV